MMLTRLMAAFAAAYVVTGAASAADLAARPYAKVPAPVVTPVYNWGAFISASTAAAAQRASAGTTRPIYSDR